MEIYSLLWSALKGAVTYSLVLIGLNAQRVQVFLTFIFAERCFSSEFTSLG